MKTNESPGPARFRDAAVSVFVFLCMLIATALFFMWPQTSKQVAQKPAQSEPRDLAYSYQAPDSLDQDMPVQMPPMLFPGHPDHVAVHPAGIHAPVPASDIPLVSRRVSGRTGDEITTSHLTQIIIPPKAFLDKDGNIVENDVDVSYREFHNIHDIFLSGIPMKYDEAGPNGMLESAGMIEIKAAINGEELRANPDSKIQILLASVKKDGDYGLYYFDTNENKWNYKGGSETTTATLSDLLKKPQRTLVIPTYHPGYRTRSYFVKLTCVSDMTDRRAFFLAPKKAPDVFLFKFRNTPNVCPELKEVRTVTWRYRGKDAQEVFMKVFGLEKMRPNTYLSLTYEGMAGLSAEETPEGTAYQLHLQMDSTEISLPVEPVLASRASKKFFNEKWSRYEAVKSKRLNAASDDYVQFQKDSMAYMADYANEQTAVMQTVALRKFEIDGFGIWNCDRQFTPTAANVVAATFVDEHGKPLKITRGYLAEKDQNTVITFDDLSKFRYDPTSTNLFWAILDDDKLAVVPVSEFVRHKNEKRGTSRFVMRVCNDAFDSYANVQKALSFN